MIYHEVALNVPLFKLLTYSYHETIPRGSRVLVPFRGRKMCGIIWHNNIDTNLNKNKILNIEEVLNQDFKLPETWFKLIEFSARYYYYPIGMTAFVTLPHGLRQPQNINLPKPLVFYNLTSSGQQAEPQKNHHKLHNLWQELTKRKLTLAEAKELHPRADFYLNQWQEKGYLNSEIFSKPIIQTSNSISLNTEQQQAYIEIIKQLDNFKTFLLYGITGSGKTEVYFQVILSVLKQGQRVLFLLPEINLTPQMIQRIEQYFPNIPYVILHSGMGHAMRTQNYLQAMLGRVPLIIGTRLAVFTPIDRLGLIVVDEEHDTSFKQENDLRYHARDLAVWRAKQEKCPIILGSATPSLESFYSALNHKYQLIKLTKRAVEKATLPKIIIHDVRYEYLQHGFSELAKAWLIKNYQQGGMSLVYLNRRGFAPALFCQVCQKSLDCPNCSSKMVWHKKRGEMRCHHCNHRTPVPTVCPHCAEEGSLRAVGQGTQHIEETLAQWLPEAKVLRIDKDSVHHRDDWSNIYKSIKNQKVDVIIGTQMLAKGHDFAQLNLVIVLNADGSLYSADFRSSERLFAELLQVSGRCGRSKEPGQVLIQTQLPHHAVFNALKNQDYQQFARKELYDRETAGLPPFSYSAIIRADAPTYQEAEQFLQVVCVSCSLPIAVHMYGPVASLMVRLACRERSQIFLESHSRQVLHQTVSALLPILQSQNKRMYRVHFSIDIDPIEC